MSKIIHGHTRRIGSGRVSSPEYRAFAAMKNRCLNKRQARFKDYGGRGIAICDRWLHGEGGRSGFDCFLADMGYKPSPEHSLDRRDTDGPYEPGNCRWATRLEQARNTRAVRLVDIYGEQIPFSQAVEECGAVPLGTARMRLHRGWSAEDAILTPLGQVPALVAVPF